MTFDDWLATDGDYLNDSDDAAMAARLMARRAWDAAVAAERERCAKQVEDTQRQFLEIVNVARSAYFELRLQRSHDILYQLALVGR